MVNQNNETVDPLQSKVLLGHVNRFILSTVNYLTSFGFRCEERMEAMHIRLHRVDAALGLIEKKLGLLLLAGAIFFKDFVFFLPPTHLFGNCSR